MKQACLNDAVNLGLSPKHKRKRGHYIRIPRVGANGCFRPEVGEHFASKDILRHEERPRSSPPHRVLKRSAQEAVPSHCCRGATIFLWRSTAPAMHFRPLIRLVLCSPWLSQSYFVVICKQEDETASAASIPRRLTTSLVSAQHTATYGYIFVCVCARVCEFHADVQKAFSVTSLRSSSALSSPVNHQRRRSPTCFKTDNADAALRSKSHRPS